MLHETYSHFHLKMFAPDRVEIQFGICNAVSHFCTASSIRCSQLDVCKLVQAFSFLCSVRSSVLLDLKVKPTLTKFTPILTNEALGTKS